MSLNRKMFVRQYGLKSGFKWAMKGTWKPYQGELEGLEIEAQDWINANEGIEVVTISTFAMSYHTITLTVWFKDLSD